MEWFYHDGHDETTKGKEAGFFLADDSFDAVFKELDIPVDEQA